MDPGWVILVAEEACRVFLRSPERRSEVGHRPWGPIIGFSRGALEIQIFIVVW